MFLVCKVCKFRACCDNIRRYDSNHFKVIKFDVMKTLSKLQIYTPILHTWGERVCQTRLH